jgi:hypothetical protein
VPLGERAVRGEGGQLGIVTGRVGPGEREQQLERRALGAPHVVVVDELAVVRPQRVHPRTQGGVGRPVGGGVGHPQIQRVGEPPARR